MGTNTVNQIQKLKLLLITKTNYFKAKILGVSAKKVII
jgi:hypothetical protein